MNSPAAKPRRTKHRLAIAYAQLRSFLRYVPGGVAWNRGSSVSPASSVGESVSEASSEIFRYSEAAIEKIESSRATRWIGLYWTLERLSQW